MKSKRWLTGITLVVLACPLPALAALGGNTASVHADQLQLKATVRTLPASAFTQFELQLPSGTTVRQYVSASGAVFAVTWEGASLPDLQRLLGSYFQRYVDAGGGTGPRLIQQPGLVVSSVGHMRAFRGRAYVPGLMPEGIALEEIQ